MKHFMIGAALLTAFYPQVSTSAQSISTARLNAPAPWDRSTVLSIGTRVADYHIAQLAGGSAYPKTRTATQWPLDPKGWEQGVFLLGLSEFSDATKSPRFKEMLIQRGIANQWKLGDRLYHADDHMVGQMYFWARRNGVGDVATSQMKQSFDRILAAPSTSSLVFDRADPKCLDRWCWCDALFMAPAAWLEMSQVTGDPRYRQFALKEFWATTDYLFDKQEHLFFRDSSFFKERDAKARKKFWSRGNGWVMGGLARMIPLMPQGDPDRKRLVSLYKVMAARILTLQKADGFWSPSLLADEGEYPPESSGTAFYVYSLAWGVNAGILDRSATLPAIRKGWTALSRAVHPDGRLGWVQAIGDQPTSSTYEDTHDYAVGALLLAATEVAKLAPAR